MGINTFAEQKQLVHLITIPKSGTHYLRNIIQNLTSIKCLQIKYIKKSRDLVSCNVWEHFHQRPNNHISIPLHKVNHGTKNHKKIILIRNLKDVLLSEIKMCDDNPYRIKWHFDHTCQIRPSEIEWNSLNIETKINYVLYHSVIKKDLELCLKFLNTNSSNFLLIHFEDLLPTSKGGSDKKAQETIQKIMNYLNIQKNIDIIKLLDDSWGNSATYTTSEKINPYNDIIKRSISQSPWENYNKAFGYE